MNNQQMAIEVALSRIRKILRLVRNAGTDGERQAAIEAARRIAEQNGIALEEVDGIDFDRVVQVEDETARCKNFSVEAKYAAQIIFRHFGVVIIFNRNRNGYNGRLSSRCRLTWVGQKINIGVAKYAYLIMLREANRYLKGKVYNSRKSYLLGFFHAIEETLRRNPLRNDVEQLRKEAERIDKSLSGVGRMKDRKSDIDTDSYISGNIDGQKVRLSRPMEGADANAPMIGETLKLGVRS